MKQENVNGITVLIADEGKFITTVYDSKIRCKKMWLGKNDVLDKYIEIDETDILSYDNREYTDEKAFNKNQSTIDALKEQKINFSRTELNKYLEEHPLKSTCYHGIMREYTATYEKQSQFSKKFYDYLIFKQFHKEAVMTWNAKGQLSEEWTEQDCLRFLQDMNDYVNPLVSYQQNIELKIKLCTRISSINDIVIDYDSVHNPL